MVTVLYTHFAKVFKLQCIHLSVGICRCSMADDMDVPPLEDMTSVLQNVLSSRDKIDDGSSSRMPVVASPVSIISGSWCTDTSDSGHFGPKTLRTVQASDLEHFAMCRSVFWTLRQYTCGVG